MDYIQLSKHTHDSIECYCQGGTYMPYEAVSDSYGHGYIWKCSLCGSSKTVGHSAQSCDCSQSNPSGSMMDKYGGGTIWVASSMHPSSINHTGLKCSLKTYMYYDDLGNEYEEEYNKVPVCHKIITDLKPIK